MKRHADPHSRSSLISSRRFSTHAPAVNHDERGNLNFNVRAAERRVDFYAAQHIDVGEELTFDYGAAFWFASGNGAAGPSRPAEGTDSRTFELDPSSPFRSWCQAEKAAGGSEDAS